MAGRVPAGNAARAAGGTVAETIRRELFDGQSRIVFEGRRLGSGGVGEVYAGRCEGGNAEVVLKELRADYDALDPVWVTAMSAECGMLRYLALKGYPAPRLLAQGDFRAGRDGLWFLMTRAPGVSLDAWQRTNAHAPPKKKLALLAALAEAIAGLHRLGVVHLDLKPNNIFVDDRRGGRPFVELIDYGNARSLAADQTWGNEALSYDYASPEHFDGLGRCREAADHFVLGVLCAQVLTGQLPFGKIPRNNPKARAALLSGNRAAVKARLRAAGVDEATADFIAMRLLVFDAWERGPGMAAELAARLAKAAGGGKRRAGWLAAGACALAVAALAVWSRETTKPDRSGPGPSGQGSGKKTFPDESTPHTGTNNWLNVISPTNSGEEGQVTFQTDSEEQPLDLGDPGHNPPGVKFEGGTGPAIEPLSPRQPETPPSVFSAKPEGITNNLRRPVVFRRNGGGGGFVLAPGETRRGTFAGPAGGRFVLAPGETTRDVDSGEYTPQGATYGDTVSRWMILKDERKPEIRIDLAHSPAALAVTNMPQREWNTLESGGWTLAENGHYVPPPDWSEGQILDIWQTRVVPADGSPADEYAWSHEWSPAEPDFEGGRFACGTTNVLTVTATRRAEIRVVDGGTARVNDPGPDWKHLPNGNWMPPEGWNPGDIKETFQKCVEIVAANRDDYQWTASWNPDPPSFAPGATCVLTVAARQKAEAKARVAVDAGGAGGAFQKRVKWGNLVFSPGEGATLLNLSDLPAGTPGVEGDGENRYYCVVEGPAVPDRNRGATNSYMIRVGTNGPPSTILSNAGAVPFSVQGTPTRVGPGEKIRVEGNGTVRLQPELSAEEYREHGEAYDWTSREVTANARYGETNEVSAALERTEKAPVWLVLAAPANVAAAAELSGNRRWLDERGEWQDEAWAQPLRVLVAGETATNEIPWLVARKGVRVTWKLDPRQAGEYQPSEPEDVAFSKPGERKRVAAVLKRSPRNVSIRNDSRIPLRAWLDGQSESEAKTIPANGRVTASWAPRSGERAPTVWYQPALEPVAWGIWGFEYDKNARQWMPKSATGANVSLAPEVDAGNVEKKLKVIREAVEGELARGLQADSPWLTDYDSALKALRGCGLATGDLPDAAWPDFGALKRAVSNKMEPVHMRVHGAKDWDDFMKLREPEGH